jgi:hypothetical protein
MTWISSISDCRLALKFDLIPPDTLSYFQVHGHFRVSSHLIPCIIEMADDVTSWLSCLLAFGTGLECLFPGLWDGGRPGSISPVLSFIFIVSY